MKQFRKLICLLTCTLFFISMFSGCAQPSANEPASTSDANEPASTGSNIAAEHGDKLVVAYTSEPPSLSTCQHDSLIAAGVNYMVFNPLYKIDNATLQAVPDLAESYTIENDVDWIFKLKKGVKFHNGMDFTAEDVKATIEYAQSFPGSVIYTKHFKEVTVIDDYTVKITTDGPYANVLYDLGYHYNFMLPKALIDEGHDFNLEPIGTGPYMLTDWVYGNSMTFTRFDDYFDEANKAKIKTIEIVVIPEAASRTVALEAGEVDMVYEVSGSDVARLQANPDITVHQVDSIDNCILFMNTDVAPFDDANFRRAIDHAINRQDIIDAALNGYGLENYSTVYQGMPGSTTENAAEFNLDKAREYLQAWGGDPSSVSMEINCSDEKRVAIGTVIQSNLAEIGINVIVTPLDTATHFKKWESGDYQTFIASWSPANSLVFAARMHSDRRKASPGAINSPEIDELVLKAQATLDEAARLKIIEQIFSISNSLSAHISLYQSQWFRAYNADVVDVVTGKSGYTDYWNIRFK